ncbi:MAG: phosphopantetheine-binding protein [Clostridiales bacterium]|jgi:acyl carrier protein|nr:phosphopantetheine-binding protein [Clostridiales bacterium]
MSIREKIRSFLGKSIDIAVLCDDDNIFEQGLVSSLFAMKLVSFIEKEWDVEIDNDELDLENFKDVDSIVKLLEKKI